MGDNILSYTRLWESNISPEINTCNDSLSAIRNELCDITFKTWTIFIYVKRYGVIMTLSVGVVWLKWKLSGKCDP